MSHHTNCCIQQEESDKYRPEAHQVGPKAWRYRHVDTECDQCARHQYATNTSQSGCLGHVSSAPPKGRPQNSAPIEGIAREEVEYREQQVAGSNKEQDRNSRAVVTNCHQSRSNEGNDTEDKACRWTCNSDSEFSSGVLWLAAHAR